MDEGPEYVAATRSDRTRPAPRVVRLDAGAPGSDIGPRQPDPSPTAGFTLLEVMIALAIVGTTLIAMLSLGNRTIATHDQLQRLTQATLLAQEKMTEVEQQATDSLALDLQDSQGVFAEPFAAFSWQTSYTATPIEQVRQVVVTVSWGDAARNEQVDLTSFVFR